MRITTVRVCKPDVRVIDIDSGAVRNLVAGRTYEVEPVAHQGRNYHVIRGTRQGGVDCYWENLQRGGDGELGYARDEGDPAIGGVALPITGRDQLTEVQYRTLVIGKLVKGKFRCNGCAAKSGHTYPESIPIMPVHILPYSQKCGACGLQVVAIWRAAKGGWLNLHD